MATPVELAVVELQIVVREFNRRLAGIERRLGIEPEEFPPKIERGRIITTLPAKRPAVVQRVGKSADDPYEIATPGRGTGMLTPERPGEQASDRAVLTPAPAATVPGGEAVQVKLSDAPPAAEAPLAAPEAAASPTAARDDGPTPGGVLSDVTVNPIEQDEDFAIPVLPPEPPQKRVPPSTKVMNFTHMYPPDPVPAISLERTLGVEVASWVGALAIMSGLLFFLALAMDSNIIPRFTAGVRISLAMVAGTMLMGHGLWLHVRKMKTIAGTMTGAGIAIWMMALFAAPVGFVTPVLSQQESFFAIPLVVLVGVGLAMYMRAPALVILSFAGLYLSPWILKDAADQSELFLPYLLIVSACALFLAQRVASWDFLRLAAFASLWIWIASWVNSDLAKAHGQLGLATIAGAFLMFLGVMAYNLKKAQTARRPRDSFESDQATIWDSIASLFSVINTGLAVVCLAVLFNQVHMVGLWVIIAGLGLVMGVQSRLVRAEYFSLVAAIQAVVLFFIALPLALQGGPITPAYAMVALGFGLYATMANSQFARALMFVALVLAAVRLFAVDGVDGALQEKIYFSGTVSLWMLLGWSTGLLALVLAWISRPSKVSQADGTTLLLGASWATVACIALSTVLVFVVNVRALAPEDPFTLAALVWIFALIALLRSGALAEITQPVETLFGVMLMLLSAKWLFYEGLLPEINNHSAAALPLINLFMLNGLFLAAAVVFLNPMHDVPAMGRRCIGWWLTALGFGLLNVQTLRAVGYFMPQPVVGIGGPELVKNVCLTVLWALFASVMVGIGFGKKSPSIRYVAMLLLAAAVIKIIFVDMPNADGLPRVLVFVLLGVLFFVVSYLYHKHISQLPQKGCDLAEALGTPA